MNTPVQTYERLTAVFATLARTDQLLMVLGHSRDSSARKDIAKARAQVRSVLRGAK